MKNKALTLTVVANMTSNYGEGLGNISTVQKIYRDGRSYAIRSKESLKNALMVQSGLYDDLEVEVSGKVNQKIVSKTVNASNYAALEGGYMNTSDTTKIRKSSFYMTDAIAFSPFVNEARFHNNLHLAQTYAKKHNINLQEKKGAGAAGLMPYQYEYDKSLKGYSITIDLDRVGIDDNYDAESGTEEKIRRVKALIKGVQNLSLVVRGNLDNAEPVFVVGGIGSRKTHYFENAVRVRNQKLILSEDLKNKMDEEYKAGLLGGNYFNNEEEIKSYLDTVSITTFFDLLEKEIEKYYEC